jgi:hypothetical protein
MAARKPAAVILPDGTKILGQITGISLEDGSGKNWNIAMANGKTLFVHAQ